MVLLLCAPHAGAAPCDVKVEPGHDVQAAIDDLAGSGTVCLAAGDFRLPGPLTITRDGVTLRGAGPSTTLRLADGVQTPVVIVGDHRRQVPERPTADATLEDLRVVGAGAGGTEFHAAFPYLSNSAVVVRAGVRTTLRDLEISGCRSACVVTEHDTRDLVIEGCRITESTWDGIALNRTTGARITDNTIASNTAAGITAEHLEDSVVARNVVRDNHAHGVYLSDSYRNRFRDNAFEGNTNAGIFLTCAVRIHDPGRVRCWDRSMSAGNTFEGDVFARNRRTFIVAADAAADCRAPGFVPNVARGERYEGGPHVDEDPARFGPCLDDGASAPR